MGKYKDIQKIRVEAIAVEATGLFTERDRIVSVMFMPGRTNRRGHAPITRLGKSNRSRRMWKQNVVGTGVPSGFNNTQCE